MTLLPAFGGQIFGVLFGYTYESTGGSECKGNKCFEDTFLISAGSCCLCLVANVYLLWKRSRVIGSNPTH
jgi:hypothetical protein